MTENYSINYNGGSYNLGVDNFSEDELVDLNELLQVDINNIMGDLITWAPLMNKIHLMKVNIDDALREKKLSVSILEAKKKEELRVSLIRKEETSRSIKYVPPTDTRVKDNLLLDPEVQEAHRELLELEKQKDIMEGLYNSAKSKDQKLNTISMKLSPEEFNIELVSNYINGIFIRKNSNSYKHKQ